MTTTTTMVFEIYDEDDYDEDDDERDNINFLFRATVFTSTIKIIRVRTKERRCRGPGELATENISVLIGFHPR